MVKQLNKAKNKPKNTSLILILTAFGTEFLFFILFCVLGLIFDINHCDYYIFSVASLALGSAASGFISARKKREKGMLYGALYALPANAVIMLISAVLNSFYVDYNLLLTFALLVVCSATGGVISVNIRPKKAKIFKRK